MIYAECLSVKIGTLFYVANYDYLCDKQSYEKHHSLQMACKFHKGYLYHTDY